MLSSTLKIFSKQIFSRIRQFQIVVNKGYFLKKKYLWKKCLQGMYYLETKGNLITKTPSWSNKCIFLVHSDLQKNKHTGILGIKN